MPSIYADQNIAASMLYQRGDPTSTPWIRTVSRKQIDNVVSKYNLRENRCVLTVTEMSKLSTDRWSIEKLESGRFLILKRSGL